jgi:GTP:adenosylcobinamide-phosphate guanylyltransferase
VSAAGPGAGGGVWTALVLAGQRPGIDPLAAHFGLTYKALIPVAGRPMLARVVETLLASPSVGRIVVLAQEPEALRSALAADSKVSFAVSGSGIASSIDAQLKSGGLPWPVLVTTADHPLLTPQMVEAFTGAAQDCDLAIAMVERTTLLAAYPDNRRTWLRFSDGAFSGANLFALRSEKVEAGLRLWMRAEKDRKHALKLFWHFGPWLALRAATRTIGLAAGLERAGKRLGLRARLVQLDIAEAAIDVDKVSDHVLAEAILAKREA